MINFRTLKVKGFKSFVEPTEILIENGLTGIVGPNEGSKARNVYFQDEIELEEYLHQLKEKRKKMTFK